MHINLPCQLLTVYMLYNITDNTYRFRDYFSKIYVEKWQNIENSKKNPKMMFNVMIQTSKYRTLNTSNIYTPNFEHLENEPEPYFYMFIQLLKASATFPTIMVTTYTTC